MGASNNKAKKRNVHIQQPDMDDEEPHRIITITLPNGKVQKIIQYTNDPASPIEVCAEIDKKLAAKLDKEIREFLKNEAAEKQKELDEEEKKNAKKLNAELS